MQSLLATLLALLGLAAPAPAAPTAAPVANAVERLPAGDATGTRARVARPGDDVAHPSSTTEWWYVHALDPKTGRTIIVTLFSAPVPVAGGFWYDADGGKVNWNELSAPRPHRGPGVTLAAGSVTYDARRRVWNVTSTSGGYDVRLRLSRTVPGVTAGPVRFGDESMWWTAPVATGRADGVVVLPGGERVEVRGWRAYHDHNYGRFDLQSTAYRGWEWAVAHEPDGRVALLGGLAGTDGRFRGVLVRGRPGRTALCRPSLVLSRFTVVDGHRFPQVVTARCPGGARARFTVTEPYVVRLATHALTESVGTSDVPGSLGLIEHLAALATP